jgi:hypothetical protein
MNSLFLFIIFIMLPEFLALCQIKHNVTKEVDRENLFLTHIHHNNR